MSQSVMDGNTYQDATHNKVRLLYNFKWLSKWLLSCYAYSIEQHFAIEVNIIKYLIKKKY